MPQEPNGRGLIWLIAAKVVCCGGLLLAVSGVLSFGGLAGWFLDGGMLWLGMTAFTVAILYLVWRRRPRLTAKPNMETNHD